MSASRVLSLHSSLCRISSHLFLLMSRGRRRECFCLSLIFEIATKLGTSPWCWRVKGQPPNPRKTTTLSLLCAHTGCNVPVSPCICGARWSKWVQALRSVKCRFLSRHICVSRYTPSCLGSQLWALVPLTMPADNTAPLPGIADNSNWAAFTLVNPKYIYNYTHTLTHTLIRWD